MTTTIVGATTTIATTTRRSFFYPLLLSRGVAGWSLLVLFFRVERRIGCLRLVLLLPLGSFTRPGFFSPVIFLRLLSLFLVFFFLPPTADRPLIRPIYPRSIAVNNVFSIFLSPRTNRGITERSGARCCGKKRTIGDKGREERARTPAKKYSRSK